MFRSTAALALLLVFSAEAWAQLIARPGPRISRPAGVIQPPSLPIAGSLTAPSPTSPARVFPRPFLGLNPYYGYGYGGYAPYWPDYYDYDSMNAPNVPLATVPEPKQAPISAPPTSAPPPETKARLTLNIPPGALVTLAGQEVDSAANPVLLESPDLREGQRYTFDIKVSWKERDKMQERARKVVVDAGDTKSLTCTAQK